MPTVLIADDDKHIRLLVSHFLAQAGYHVVEAADGEEALAKVEERRVELAILDIMMPRMDGWELCRLLKRFYDFPILMLSAKGETSQKVKGLDIGADDYLVKPFEAAELLARTRALLRRYKIASSQQVQLGRLALDRSSREAVAGKERFTLPLKEFELLFKLGSYPGRTFTREALIEELWGSDFDGTERTVDVHVNRLRDRFPEERFGFKITAIRGLGYRLEIAP